MKGGERFAGSGERGLAALADVAIPLGVHGTFTYAIPERLRDGVRLGSRVEVPIGPKRSTGFVVELHDRPLDPGTRLRPIQSVLDDDEPAARAEHAADLADGPFEVFGQLQQVVQSSLHDRDVPRFIRERQSTAVPDEEVASSPGASNEHR